MSGMSSLPNTTVYIRISFYTLHLIALMPALGDVKSYKT